MFDISFAEIFIILVAGLLVLGPKEIPVAVKYIVQLFAKLRDVVNEFKSQFDDIANIKQEIEDDIEFIKGDDGNYYPIYKMDDVEDTSRPEKKNSKPKAKAKKKKTKSKTKTTNVKK